MRGAWFVIPAKTGIQRLCFCPSVYKKSTLSLAARASHFLCWCKESNQRNTFLFTYGVFADATSMSRRRTAHILCALIGAVSLSF
jgi:hypothetical protein